MFQGPFSIMAALPAVNWLSASPWPQPTTLADTEPSFTRLARKSSAWAFCGEFSRVSVPPLLHIQGMNCQVPSYVFVPANAKPYLPFPVSFFASDASSAHVVGGVRPAAANMSLL